MSSRNELGYKVDSSKRETEVLGIIWFSKLQRVYRNDVNYLKDEDVLLSSHNMLYMKGNRVRDSGTEVLTRK